MTREQQRQPHAGCPGVISVHELYTLEEARRRMRWTESALRAARRRGLKLLSCGKRKYVRGKEIVTLSGRAAGGHIASCGRITRFPGSSLALPGVCP